MKPSASYLTLANERLGQNAIPNWSRLAILISMTCLIVPAYAAIPLGPILLRYSHISMIIMGFVAIEKLLSGKISIKVTLADWLMFIHVVVICFSSIYHNAFGQGTETAVSTFIRMGVAYFVARVVICNLLCYRYFVRIVILITSVSAIFGIIEMLTGYSVIRALYRTLFPSIEYIQLHGKRLGLFRAQTTFQHSILYGLSSVIAFALAVYYKPHYLGMKPKLFKLCIVLCSTGVFASLSSAPWLAMLLCILFLVYGKIFKDYKNRWRTIIIIIGLLFLITSVLSNRGPVKLIITYMTFHAQTGYTRIGMWESVIAMIPNYWQIGWGWGAGWPRVDWYIWESIDSYYALWFVRSGIIPIIAIFCFLIHLMNRIKKAAQQTYLCTNDIKGWCLAATSLFIVLFTVHIFGNIVTIVYFMLGAGQSLLAICESMPQKKIVLKH